VSTEARRNLIALAVAALVLLVFAAFAFRPGVLLPITNNAVADSLALSSHIHNVRCHNASEGFRCTARFDSSSGKTTRHMLVHVGWDGCWRSRDVTGRHPERDSGCVHLWNYVG
jgi:hypothetical protein